MTVPIFIGSEIRNLWQNCGKFVAVLTQVAPSPLLAEVMCDRPTSILTTKNKAVSTNKTVSCIKKQI